MKTGFLIINYNDFNSTMELLNNIKDYKIIDRIVVVDNKSTDNSLEELKGLKIKKLKVVVNSDNKGYSSAINLGCKELIKDLKKCNIIISNADIIINNEEDLKELLNHLDKKNIGVVAPTILENNKLNRGWKQPSPIVEIFLNIPYIHRFVRKNFVYYNEEHYEKEISEVDVVSGCFFLMNSDTIKEVNYFDENVFLYYEENILAKKLKDVKKKIIVANKIIIIHNHSVTIDKNINKIKKYQLQKNSQYYFEKNYNNANRVECFFLKVTASITKLILLIYYKLLDLKNNK